MELKLKLINKNIKNGETLQKMMEQYFTKQFSVMLKFKYRLN